MPLYEYRCKACGKPSERLVRSAAASPPPCPHCGSRKSEKLLSSFAALASHPEAALPCSSGGCSRQACPTGSCPYGS